MTARTPAPDEARAAHEARCVRVHELLDAHGVCRDAKDVVALFDVTSKAMARAGLLRDAQLLAWFHQVLDARAKEPPATTEPKS